MATEIGDIIGQAGSGDYKLVKGKDVSLTEADLMGSDLEDNDLILIDDGAAGTQASTKKSVVSRIFDYIVTKFSSVTSFNVGNYTFETNQTVGSGQDNYVLTYDNSDQKISLEPASSTFTFDGDNFATDLKVGRDADNLIDFTTDNEITFRVSAGDGVVMKASGEIEATKFDGALEGNADTATTLATARAINGVDFDGSQAITVPAAGSTLTDTVPVSKGGTGATSFADKSVLITQDSGTDTVAAVAMSTNGQLLIGGTDGPAVATLSEGSNISITNGNGTISIASTDTNTQLSTEAVQDIVGAMFSSNTETRISATYQDADGTIDLAVDDMTANDNTTYSVSCVDGDNSDEEKIRLTDSSGATDDVVLEAGTGLSIARSGDKITFTNTVSDTNTQLSTEEVQDIAGAMFSSNTESGITATYQDADGTIDLEVGSLTVAQGGTGATSLANDGVLTGGGTSAITSESNVKVSQGVLVVSNSTSSSSGGIRFKEAEDNGTAYTTLQAAADNSNSNPVITMPASTGTMALTSDIPTHTAGDGLTLTGVDFDIDAAQTTITSVLNANLKIGTAATDEYIDFGAAANVIRMAVNDSSVVDVSASGIEVAGAISVSGTNNISCNGNVGDTANNDFVSFGTDGEVSLVTNNSARLTASDTGVSAANMNVTSELNSKKNIFEKTGNTDFTYQGDVVKIGTGSTTQGELCYYKSDGTWGAADADAVATSGGCLLAIALGTDPDSDGMLLRGMFTLDHDPGTIADELYVSTTAGDITSTAPSGNGDIVRVIGYCLDSTNGQIWFNPSNDYIEITA